MQDIVGRIRLAAALVVGLVLAPTAGALAAETVTTLAISPAKAVYGQPVTFTATVRQKGTTTPVSGGTVAFKRGGVSLGTATVTAGKATLVVAAPATGGANAVASFGGSGDDTASTSKATALLVSFARTTTALTLPSTWVHVDTALTATATVKAIAPSAAVPKGSVQFKLGTKVLRTVALDATGKASLDVKVARPGAYQLAAIYRPASGLGFQASTSRWVPFTGTFAVSDEVALASGSGLVYAVSKVADKTAVMTAVQVADDVRFGFCVFKPGEVPSPQSCRTFYEFRNARIRGLALTSLGRPGASGSVYAAFEAMLDFGTLSGIATVPSDLPSASASASPAAAMASVAEVEPSSSMTFLNNAQAVKVRTSKPDPAGDTSVVAAIYRLEGRGIGKVGSDIVVATSTKPVTSTSVASDMTSTDGGFSVGWIVDGSQIFIRRYTADGTPLGDAEAISPIVSSGIADLDLEGVSHPAGVVATWTQKASGTTGPTDLRMRRFDGAGEALPIGGVVTDPKGAQSQAKNEWFESLGGWGTVWTSRDGAGTGVFGKLFDMTGKPTSADFPLNVTKKGDQHSPVMASKTGTAEFLAFWISDNADGTSSLMARRFLPY